MNNIDEELEMEYEYADVEDYREPETSYRLKAGANWQPEHQGDSI